MTKLSRTFISLVALTLAAISGIASATNYTLWVNGRSNPNGVIGDYTNFSYWGPSGTLAGVNKKAVNWDGYNTVSSQNVYVRNALDCFCTGNNWCYVAAHSTGDLMMGYTMATYGGTTRYKKNATPASNGVCGNSDGTTQTGWNIKWVRIASGAAGGTELADAGSWAMSEPLVSNLKTSTARAMYNHNSTRGVWFYMYAAAAGTAYSFLLPGQDDEVLAYHTTGAVSGSGTGSYCNPSDWLCDDLTKGTAANENGVAKWSYHSVIFRDDNEAYNHYGNGVWGGIISVVRAAMVSLAI